MISIPAVITLLTLLAGLIGIAFVLLALIDAITGDRRSALWFALGGLISFGLAGGLLLLGPSTGGSGLAAQLLASPSGRRG
jgi:hypothetical protein